MENYEQRYQEALERAKGAHNSAKSDKENGVTDKITEYTIQLTETIFPELKESEDEKIIRIIKKVLWDCNEGNQSMIGDKDVAKCIAWLEKQGENYSWSEEDELMIQDAIHWINEFQKSNRCKDENDMQNSVTCENWLKSIKDRVQSQPKQEWSEEDEEKLNSIIEVLGEDSLLVDWLKSLKDRISQSHWKPNE